VETDDMTIHANVRCCRIFHASCIDNLINNRTEEKVDVGRCRGVVASGKA
jgi:hypothetical protein